MAHICWLTAQRLLLMLIRAQTQLHGYAYSQFSNTYTDPFRYNMNRNRHREWFTANEQEKDIVFHTSAVGVSLSIENIVLVFAFPLFSNMFVMPYAVCDTFGCNGNTNQTSECVLCIRFWMLARVKLTAFRWQPVTLTLFAHTFECVCLFWFCCCHIASL